MAQVNGVTCRWVNGSVGYRFRCVYLAGGQAVHTVFSKAPAPHMDQKGGPEAILQACEVHSPVLQGPLTCSPGSTHLRSRVHSPALQGPLTWPV